MKDYCFQCGKYEHLEKHHIFQGAYRKRAEEYGFVVFLCHDCHNEPPNGVHHNKENRLKLRKQAQREYERTRSREDFIRDFGRNYLD